MSGFEYAFVSEVPPECICPVCAYPMREPVQTKCGHRFCKHCLKQSMKRKRKCPIDRLGLDERSAQDIYPDVAIQRTILDFIVKCPNEQNGCNWTGELRNIEKHESTCSYEGVKCTNKGCDASPLKKDLQNHVTNECPKRKVECRHCKTLYVWCTSQGHFDVCQKYPIGCLQRCGEQKIPRDKMSDHIEKRCPRTKVECTYAHVGCKVKVLRKAMADHAKESTESHLKLACERLQELQVSSNLTAASTEEMRTEMAAAMNKIKELSEAVLNGGGLQHLRDKISEINKLLQGLHGTDEVATEKLSALQADVVSIKKELKEITKKLSNNETFLELKDEINELQELIRPRIDTLQGLRGEVAGTQKKLRKLQEAISSLEKQNSLKDVRGEVVGNINKKLQKLQQAITRLEKRDSDAIICRETRVSDEIDYTKWELRCAFQAELRRLRENAERERNAGQLRVDRGETFRKFVIIIFYITIFLFVFRYGTIVDLYLLLFPMF